MVHQKLVDTGAGRQYDKYREIKTTYSRSTFCGCAIMLSEYLLTLINNGENSSVEFKVSFQKEAIESIVALSNLSGGYVFIGIDDQSNILGVSIENETIQNYVNQIKNSTEPSLIIDIEVIKINTKDILVIKVNEFPIKHVNYKGKYFKRVNNSNHQMNLMEISNMHLQSLQLSWDAYESNSATYEDLDTKKIQKFIEKVNENKRFTLNENIAEALVKLSFLKKLQPTNAAMLLFAKEQHTYNIHIGRFKTAATIIDDKMIK